MPVKELKSNWLKLYNFVKLPQSDVSGNEDFFVTGNHHGVEIGHLHMASRQLILSVENDFEISNANRIMVCEVVIRVSDSLCIESIGGDEMAKTPRSLIRRMLRYQGDGGPGPLTTDGNRNVFFVPGIHGLIAVSFLWYPDFGWDIGAHHIDPLNWWKRRTRVFFLEA